MTCEAIRKCSTVLFNQLTNSLTRVAIQISAVINTYNEEANIEGCLGCLAGNVDEIVISDMQSTDRTIEICRKYTDNIAFQPRQRMVNSVREEGIARAKHEWIFVIDCDERVQPALFHELRRLASENVADTFNIHRINFFFGANITGRGWPSEYIERFFRKGSVCFLNHPHRWVERLGKTIDLLPKPEWSIKHYAHPTIYTFVQKMNGYTDSEALLMRDLGWNASFKRLVLRPLKIFCLHYFKLRGYCGGTAGLLISCLMMVYWFVAGLKLLELQSERSK